MVLGACSLLIVSSRPARADEKISEEAKLYFQNGVELIQGQPPNYQDAYYQFKLAWDKSKSWKVLGNWGLCALKLERDGEAIWAYTEYLKKGGNDVDPEERKDLTRDLLLLNGNSATLDLGSTIADLDVLDTRAGSSAPPQSYKLEGGHLTLKLRAGSHALTASAQGKTLRWDVSLSPGKNEQHVFDFSEPKPASAATPAAPVANPAIGGAIEGAPADKPAEPAKTPSDSGGGLRTAGYVVTGAGVVLLGGGLLAGLAAKNKDSDTRTNKCRTESSVLVCPNSTKDDFSSASSLAKMSTALWVVGGVATAAGVGMIVWGGPSHAEHEASAALKLLPLLGPRDAGLFAAGSF